MRLLVSVRSAAEAETALVGGAALIDVKEPSRGPLGRADEAVVRSVVQTVAGRTPVSAALGELFDQAERPYSALGSLDFVKWGLAGATRDWQQVFLRSARSLSESNSTAFPAPQAVLVAYADADRACAPPVGDVVAFACRRSWPATQHVLLLDTTTKSPQPSSPCRPTLLDWLPLEEVVRLCVRCRAADVRVALAGCLGAGEIRRLLPARPDWFAVRGAACMGQDRQQTVCADRVRGLVRLLTEESPI